MLLVGSFRPGSVPAPRRHRHRLPSGFVATSHRRVSKKCNISRSPGRRVFNTRREHGREMALPLFIYGSAGWMRPRSSLSGVSAKWARINDLEFAVAPASPLPPGSAPPKYRDELPKFLRALGATASKDVKAQTRGVVSSGPTLGPDAILRTVMGDEMLIYKWCYAELGWAMATRAAANLTSIDEVSADLDRAESDAKEATASAGRRSRAIERWTAAMERLDGIEAAESSLQQVFLRIFEHERSGDLQAALALALFLRVGQAARSGTPERSWSRKRMRLAVPRPERGITGPRDRESIERVERLASRVTDMNLFGTQDRPLLGVRQWVREDRTRKPRPWLEICFGVAQVIDWPVPRSWSTAVNQFDEAVQRSGLRRERQTRRRR
jgi:hypothetical protein